MPDLTIHAAIEQWKGRDVNQQDAAGFEPRPKRFNDGTIVADVLEDVHRVNEVETFRWDLVQLGVHAEPDLREPRPQVWIWLHAAYPVPVGG